MSQPVRSFVNFHNGESCLPPALPIEAPVVHIPDDACDTHAHVFGNPDIYNCLPNSHYIPATESSTSVSYFSMLKALSMTRGVVVQPSVYGTDNRLMLETINHNKRLRGIAVIDESISDDELIGMDAAGVRGVRFNLIYRGGTSLLQLERIAHRIAPLGWHIDILMQGQMLPEIAPKLSALPLQIVFDHMAQMPVFDNPNHASFTALWKLIDSGKAYIKLSGANRYTSDGEEAKEVTQWRKTLINKAVDACLWGSDWPHVGVPLPINSGKLFNAFNAAFECDEDRTKVLVKNPENLYRF